SSEKLWGGNWTGAEASSRREYARAEAWRLEAASTGVTTPELATSLWNRYRPELDGPIGARGGNPVAVRRECDSNDRPGATGDSVQQLAICCVPQFEGAVLVAACHDAAVRAKRDAHRQARLLG